MDGNLWQVCATEEYESKGIIVDESSTEKSESECVHKNINKEKDANNEAEYEETPVKHDPVVNRPSYFNILECGKIIFNNLDVTYEQARMATPRDK